MDYLEILTAVATVLVPMVGTQTFWIVRALNRIERRIDGVYDRLDHIDQTILRDHGERISRLEAGRP
jgi:hypothetical protein